MINVDLLLIRKDLSRSQSRTLFRNFLKNKLNAETGKQILCLLQKKGEHVNELTGFIEVVQAIEKPVRFNSQTVVDGCGTGGDEKHSFNISTVACLIAAAAGATVAKHGNRSVSSQCGSSDLLESLGIKINASKKQMLRALHETGFGYFHAPLYHPIFKQAQSIRLELAKKKIKTLFNLAGPLLNPLRPKHQLIGVFKKDFVPVIAQTARNLKLKHVMVVWNAAGYDEITTGQRSIGIELNRRRLKRIQISPKCFHLEKCRAVDLKGGSVRRNRQIALDVLSGKPSAKLDVVLLNAGTILYISEKAKNIEEGICLAKQAVHSRRALKLLNHVIKLSRQS